MLTVSMKNGNMDDIPLYFQSDDCSGVAYVAPISSINIGRNRKKYYVGEKTVPTRMQVNSLLGRDKCYKHNAEEDLVLAQKATLPFPVPVALPFDFHLNN